MAQEQAPPSGPDLTKGVAIGDFKDDKLLGHVGDEAVLLARSGGEYSPSAPTARHYHGPLADGLVVGDTRALPLASRLLRSAHRRGAAAPGAQPAACWPVEERDGRSSSRKRKQEAGASAATRIAEAHRHRRRRRGRLCGGRDAAPARLCRQHRHAERRQRAAGRSAQSVEGLSRRQRAGGLGAAAADDFYAENKIDLRLNTEVTAIDPKAQEVALANGGKLDLTTGCCWRPAPSRCGWPSRAPTPPRPHAALARRQPRHHRRTARPRSARW